MTDFDPFFAALAERILGPVVRDSHGHQVQIYTDSAIGYGAAARTVGHSIYVATGVDYRRVVDHEIMHVEQYDDMGRASFLYVPGNLVAMGVSAGVSGIAAVCTVGMSEEIFQSYANDNWGRGAHWRYSYSRFNPFEWGPYSRSPSAWSGPIDRAPSR